MVECATAATRLLAKNTHWVFSLRSPLPSGQSIVMQVLQVVQVLQVLQVSNVLLPFSHCAFTPLRYYTIMPLRLYTLTGRKNNIFI